MGVAPAGEQIAGSESGALAYIMNVSDHPIRIYVPGFVGPNIGGTIGDNRPIQVMETHAQMLFGPGDFVVLRPREAFTRQRPLDRPAGRSVSAHYLLYKEGEEGMRDSISELVYPLKE